MTRSACPTAEELTRFALGALAEPRFAEVVEHLESCAACDDELQAFDAVTDSVVSGLQRPQVCGATLAGVPSRLFAAAKAAGEGGVQLLRVQERFGRFELLEELGAGSFGHVFRARDTELDRIVAVKIPRAGRLAGPDESERFLREARSAAQLKHPGIVSIYETGQAPDGTCYLVEEFVPGETLSRRLEHERPTPEQAASLVAAVAEALDYAHRHGVIHRDVKPANILLGDRPSAIGCRPTAVGNRPERESSSRPTADSRKPMAVWPTADSRQPIAAKLADFGLAKRAAEDAPMTLEGQVLGTPAYMSPEQARGEAHRVDARTDIYSLGVVLYELLTGERPFGGNRRMLILQVLEDEPRPPRQLNDRCPRDLETICLKAMAKPPARRYATAGELAEDLQRYLAGEPIQARPVGWAERGWRWCRRNPVPASLLLAVTFGSAFGLWYLSQLSQELVRSTALTGAAQEAELLEMINDHYSRVFTSVSPHLKPEGQGVMPFPARLTINLGNDLSDNGRSGMQVRLYSDYPFRTRNDGGPHDDFERDALDRLRRSPQDPVYRFEDFQGRPVLRYATARIMKADCLQCHNYMPDSVKKDWQVGDVRGVLEIIRPLDQDIAQTRQGLRGTFLLVAVLSVALLGLSVLVLMIARSRR